MQDRQNGRERNQFSDQLGLGVGMELTANGCKETLGNVGNVLKLSGSDGCPTVYFY